jgi:AcrR family transcriptional regulator
MVRASQGPGRPRDTAIDESIVRATTELLSERGYSGITVDAVAARAGVGKAAIYRRYASKQELIFSVVVRGMDDVLPPDAGTLHADLSALCQLMAGRLSSAPTDVLTRLLADIYGDSLLADRFSSTYLAQERRAVTDVLSRAVARRELAAMPDAATVHALLAGPIFAWVLVLSEDPARLADLTKVVAAAVALLLAQPAGSPDALLQAPARAAPFSP